SGSPERARARGSSRLSALLVAWRYNHVRQLRDRLDLLVVCPRTVRERRVPREHLLRSERDGQELSVGVRAHLGIELDRDLLEAGEPRDAIAALVLDLQAERIAIQQLEVRVLLPAITRNDFGTEA